MSTRARSRPTGKSYTARLYQHTATRRHARQRPTWLTARVLPALVTLAAELGHLAAALIEWPGAPARGLAHILAAAGLGLFTVMLYFGHSRVELALGIGLTLAIPVLWFAGALVGTSLYGEFPLLPAIAVSTAEVGVAVLLTAHLRGV